MTRSRVYVIVAMTTKHEKQKKDTKKREKNMTHIEENEKEKKKQIEENEKEKKKQIESHEERTKISKKIKKNRKYRN